MASHSMAQEATAEAEERSKPRMAERSAAGSFAMAGESTSVIHGGRATGAVGPFLGGAFVRGRLKPVAAPRNSPRLEIARRRMR